MRRGLALACLASLACAQLGATRPPGLSDVVEVRHWSYPDYTRIVVETTQAVDIATRVTHLGADPAAKRPERLYVDLHGLWVGREYVDGIRLSDGLLQGIRLGQNTLDRVRIVLDLEHYENHRLFTLEHPHRVVIDVFGRRHAPDRRAPGLPPRVGARAVQTVVIDPGHGGKDPGAIGIGGTREKTVTLKLSRTLGAKLKKLGFDVIFTRSDDRSISLEERTAIVEAARADLFVSIHANAAPRRSVNGIETYFLDENHERHSLTVAARENGISRNQVDDLQKTLTRLRVSELSGYSRQLAGLVQSGIIGGLPSRFQANDLGVKKGPFYVLFLSDTPAILVETGFLTNREESLRLRDDAYLEALADGIAAGLTRYRDGFTTMARRSGS